MLARAICQDTQVLILDEPTSYLDMGFKLDILTTIRMLARKKNLAVIMSLHELDLAQKISDIIACVKGDRIDRVGTPEEIFSGNYVQQLYGVSHSSLNRRPDRFYGKTGRNSGGICDWRWWNRACGLQPPAAAEYSVCSRHSAGK